MCHVGRECGLTIMGKWCDSERGIRGKACSIERVRRKVLTGRGVEWCREREEEMSVFGETVLTGRGVEQCRNCCKP